MTRQVEPTAEDVFEPQPQEVDDWVRMLSYVQIATGLVAMLVGLGLIIIASINAALGTIGVGGLFGVLIVQLLPFALLGTFLFFLGQELRALEEWAFPWVIYGNLIVIVAYFLLAPNLALISLVNLIPIILLFTPRVREHWFELFREDMKPRIKETRYSLYLIRRSPLVVVGLVIIVAFLVMAVFAPFLVHYGESPYVIPRFYDHRLEPPNARFWFGTDYLGSDIYSSVIWGAQIDIRIAVSVVGVALIIGTFLGAFAGYSGGWIDEVMMRITDVFFAFPGLILAMAVVAALGGRSLDNISIALMFVWWPAYARLVRGQVLMEREKLYVEAARSVGATDARILIFHILPNTIQPVIVQATLDMGGVLLTAAGLSFIGYGAEPGTAEWGLMISDGQQYFERWWVTVFPGMAILLCALAFNLVGDGVRDILDPKLRRRA